MPALVRPLEATVLTKREPSEKHRAFGVYCQEQGLLTVHQRLSSAKTSPQPLDLFDDAALVVKSSNQGQTWFVGEVQILRRRAEIGASYAALLQTSAFTQVILRNAVGEESRPKVAALLRQVLDAFAAYPELSSLVHLKGLYAFARLEGYPVRQQWLDYLHERLHLEANYWIQLPLAEVKAGVELPPAVPTLLERLQGYLRAHTELNLD